MGYLDKMPIFWLEKGNQATNGSGFWQSRGSEPHGRRGQGFASENADFGAIHVQPGPDLVGADWERRPAATPLPSALIGAIIEEMRLRAALAAAF